VTLKVTEGLPYAWSGAEWIGNTSVPKTELDGLLGLKPGEIADMTKIDAGLRTVRRAYGTKGYIRQASTYSPRLDEAARKAVFEIRIQEGPQFRYGTVEFVGFSDADAAALTKRWQPRAGDVYDDSYPLRFQREEIMPLMKRAGGARRPMAETRSDASSTTVNIRFVLK
jgi:outer membrane protein assembly factor BamA